MLKNYHFTYLNSSFTFFNLAVSTWVMVSMASVKSLLNPGACGFTKAILYEKSCDKQTYSEMHNSCNRNFDITKNMLVEIEQIRRRLSKLKKCIQNLGEDSPAKKDEFLGFFLNLKWEKLHIIEKKRQSAYHYFESLSKYPNQLNLVPASRQLLNTQQKSEVVIPIPKVNPVSSRFSLMDLTNQLYRSVNEQFQSINRTDFATAQSKSKETSVKKAEKAEKQKIRRQSARKILFDIQKAKSNTKVIRYIYIFLQTRDRLKS